ncbi:MAG: alpha-ketoglutarate-dependent dioxygenase AlkB [Cocleimonas sp.]
MNLFDFDHSLNLLPYDGTVNYFGPILSPKTSDDYFNYLLNHIEWKNDEVIIYGNHITTKRKIAWYGDKNYHYSYSNTTKKALPWTTELLDLKATVEEKADVIFNSCLINLYHDGDEGVAWHSDDEYSLDSHAAIASLSFGAQRKFSFKHKSTKEAVSLELEAGSLLIMKGETQRYWLHSLPKTTKVTEPRINLTFRVMK